MKTEITRRGALLAFGAAFLSAAIDANAGIINRWNNLLGDDTPAPEQPSPAARTNIYASDLTRKKFPIIDQIPDWTSNRVKTVHVISPEDFTGTECKKAIIRAQNRLIGEISLTEELSSYDPETIYKIQQEVRETLERVVRKNITVHLTDEYIKSLCDRIISGVPSSQIVHLDAADITSRIAIISTPYADAPKQIMACLFTGIPAGDFENIEGTDEEVAAVAIMHEVAEILKYDSGSLAFEIDADMNMSRLWQWELNKGTVKTPGVPDDWQRMRAINSILSDDPAQATNAAIQSGEEGYPPASSEKIFIESRKMVIEQARERMRAYVASPIQYLNALHNILNYQPAYQGAEKIVLSAADEKIINQLFKSITNIQWTEISDQLQRLSQPNREKIYNIFQVITADIGELSMRNNHALVYATIADLLHEGVFLDDPIAAQYAWEFLEAAKRLAPKHFETDNYKNNNFIPPVFDENGMEVIQYASINGPKLI
jgi:hypothetical protein